MCVRLQENLNPDHLTEIKGMVLIGGDGEDLPSNYQCLLIVNLIKVRLVRFGSLGSLNHGHTMPPIV